MLTVVNAMPSSANSDAAGLLLLHARQQTQCHAQRAEVVELHGALEVVEALERMLDRTADGPPGVVDQDVD
jgi:hypothetical protein